MKRSIKLFGLVLGLAGILGCGCGCSAIFGG